MAEIVVIAAHPDLARSRANRALLERLRPLQARSGGRIALRELYRLYPDFVIDGATERAALAEARLIVWLYPLHWYGMPALMKLWVDEVLQLGWAYGPGGTALRGKDLWLLCTTGGSAASYDSGGHNEHPIEAFLLPQRQTAGLCGLRFLPPLVLHSACAADPEQLAQHALTIEQRLLDHPHWCEAQPAPEPVHLDEHERPAPEADALPRAGTNASTGTGITP